MFAKKTLASLFAAILFFAVSPSIFADTIHLKDGSVIKGKVVDFKNQQFTVVLSGSGSRRSQLTLYIDDVDWIEFDSSSGNNSNTSNVSSSGDNSSSQTNVAAAPRTETAAPANTNVNPSSSGERTNTTNGSVGGDNAGPSAPANTATNNARQTQTSPANSQNAVGQSNQPLATNNNSSNPNGGITQVINAQPTQSATPRVVSNARNVKFVATSVKVLADNTANGWTNTGLVVKKGQRLRISASGRISLGGGKFATPAGVASIADNDRLVKTEPTGGLIAVIGDDNNDFIFIGSIREFEAARDGTLFLGVNESNLNDNSGAFDAVVEAEAIDATTPR